MTLLGWLRLSIWMEGLSYLALWLLAMPLKYLFGIPLAVRVVGGLHGILFIAFVLLLYQTHLEKQWSKRRSLSLFWISLIPGSLFWLDRNVKHGED